MTCILAFKTEEGDYVIAGDINASNAFSSKKIKGSKVIRKNDEVVFGYTTSFRFGNILEHKWEVPPKSLDISENTYIFVDLVDSIRETLLSNGYGAREGAEDLAGSIVLIYRDRIFSLYDNYALIEYADDIHAVGSGADAARGILHYVLPIKNAEVEDTLVKLFKSVSMTTHTVSEEFTVMVGFDE